MSCVMGLVSEGIASKVSPESLVNSSQVELQLRQNFANRSNFNVKCSTSAHWDVERINFGENSVTCIRAIRQEKSIGKDSKPFWFGVKNIKYTLREQRKKSNI
ncbi:hypothetical protein TNCV_3493121 [Trichonephila clavipes]|nr:hypothetical protein TNCV_3493121 [Trichonephila clavipes]